MCRKSDTVIIYFALSANEDLKQNRFSGSRVHRQLISKLHRRILKSIRSTGLPVLSFNEENQVGDNLAERLTNAFAQAFAEGYQNVIALGNDTPDLDANLINDAADTLTTGNPVLGPSRDGGNYLIGLRKEDFDETTLCAALENSNETNSRLGELLRNHRAFEILADIDDEKSLEAWVRSYSRKAENILFRKEIKSTITFSETNQEFVQFPAQFWTIPGISDRAPPAAIAV
jgi:2-phospho-L-lactate guanylyltransferase (CobY/MobA/RfbA family)